ncbi:MAG: amino acid adenylation domain-containing protein [Cyanobacteria bacterium P01_E01_bin.6]
MSNEEILTLKSKLSPAKQALLEKRLRGEIESNSRNQPSQEKLPTVIPNPDQRYQPFPLTDVQQAYWVGRSGAFELSNISTHVYFEVETANLNLERFEQAWQNLIDRHDMLRAIVRPDGQQQILKQVPAYKIRVLDLHGKDPEIVASQLSQLREHLSHQVLPTDQWPLFEIQVAQLDEKKIRLCLSLDILIGDAWSFDIVFGELAELIQNPATFFSPLEFSFRDYVLAELALQDSTVYQRSKDYWLSRIPTLPSAPELPLAKNLAAVKNPRFVHRTRRLNPEAWVRLKQQTREYNLTPSVLLLAAFAEVLSGWSKSPRFTLNLTLFNRLPLHPQVNQIMGDFTSLTLLAVDHSEQDSFAARSQRIQKQLWDDFDHRYFSGVQVLRELARLQKNPSGVLMPVVFTSTLINDGLSRSTPTEKLSSIGRLGDVTYNISQTPQVYLDLQVNEMGGTLFVEMDAVEELFPAGLLDDMFAAYCRFLERLADQDELWHTPTRSLLPPAQLEQLVAFNATDTPIPETTLLHSLFFEHAQQHPQKVAVITSQQRLTYQELSDRALSLARHLRQLGACPNQLVAIVMDKGWEQVVAVLAILASGAAYVPIDPDLPTERRSHLLKQTQVQCVLTQSHLDSSLDWTDTITRLCVDTLELASPDSPLEWVQRSHDLAYVIYTSGSTGKPKGVMIDHRGAVNTILDINQRFQVSAKDSVLALSSLSFDLSVYDIFGTLAAVGTIVIPDASCTKDPTHWVQMIEQHQITLWNSVPALMQMLVESVTGRHQRLPESLRLVLLSGDWLPISLPDQIRALSESVQVVSLGGATEASIWSILYPIKQVEPGWKSIPYGHPMANQRFYVLSDALQPCPLWVPGHLYISGLGLAKGYWHDEEKTDASFIIHPQTQERLYKTGDLGRVLPQGVIEFLGREDFQVKVNGYRIELGEIEVVLEQHSAVKETVVVAAGKPQGSQRLIAYVVPHMEHPSILVGPEGADLYHDEWRGFLRQKLPDYMVPSDFMILDALPLTPNGKVNRRALPMPSSTRSREKVSHVKPQTEVEQMIAAIWQDILQIENIGIHDNFFDLGGNSVLLVQAHNKLQESLQQSLSLVDLFQYPTIDTLVKHLVEKKSEVTDIQEGQRRAQTRRLASKKRRKRFQQSQ